MSSADGRTAWVGTVVDTDAGSPPATEDAPDVPGATDVVALEAPADVLEPEPSVGVSESVGTESVLLAAPVVVGSVGTEVSDAAADPVPPVVESVAPLLDAVAVSLGLVEPSATAGASRQVPVRTETAIARADIRSSRRRREPLTAAWSPASARASNPVTPLLNLFSLPSELGSPLIY
jgi:hypothetical protein